MTGKKFVRPKMSRMCLFFVVATACGTTARGSGTTAKGSGTTLQKKDTSVTFWAERKFFSVIHMTLL